VAQSCCSALLLLLQLQLLLLAVGTFEWVYSDATSAQPRQVSCFSPLDL
jgi:hypothetical protein